MASKADVTVYIGRFNPFHNGHAHVLRQALENSKLVIVLVGSSGQARSLKNPFTFDERHDMIHKWTLSQDGSFGALRILPIRDYPYNDALWIRQVQRIVKQTMTKYCLQYNDILTNIAITGSDRDESTWYLSAFPQWKQALVEPYCEDDTINVSATSVRTWLFGEVSIETMGLMAKTVPPSTLRYLEKFSVTPEFEALRREFAFIDKYKAASASRVKRFTPRLAA